MISGVFKEGRQHENIYLPFIYNVRIEIIFKIYKFNYSCFSLRLPSILDLQAIKHTVLVHYQSLI